MDHSLLFFEELAILLLLAAGTAYLCSRIRIPPVVGYLVLGIAVGPSSIGLVSEVELVRVLGELGVILLMFGLGLDFELDRLRKTATFSVVAGVASVIATFVFINATALLLGVGALEALFLAAAFSICGTAVNIKILSDMGHLKEDYGQAITATIVVTDIAAVLLLTALSGVALGGGLDARTLAFSLFKAAAFLVLAPAFGFLVIPRLLNVVARATRSREVLLVTTLALCFVFALISYKLGFSLALGAFLMGMMVSEARVYHPIEEMVKPLEHIFATLFFLSVGLSVPLGAALPYWPAILLFSVFIALTKVGAVSTAAYLNGKNGRISLAAGWGLVPIGEFAFVILNEGVRFGAVSSDYLAVTVAVALLTTLFAVFGLRSLDQTVDRITDRLPAGVLNLLTLVQLRTAGTHIVPGLAEATSQHRVPASGGRRASEPRPSRREIEEQDADQERYRRAAWRELVDINLNLVIVVTITFGLMGLAKVLTPLSPPWLNVPLAAAVAVVVLSAPSLVFIFRSGNDLARLLSDRLAERIPWIEPSVVLGALIAASTFLLFVFLMAVFLPVILVELSDNGLPVLIIAGVVTAALGYFTWRRLVRFQSAITNLVRTSLATAGRTPQTDTATRPAAAPQQEKQRPYRAMIEPIEVSAHSPVVGKTLGACGLRERIGVSVLGIERGEDWVGNPSLDTVIQAGDELVVIGSEEQRELAERYLRWDADGEDPTARQVG